MVYCIKGSEMNNGILYSNTIISSSWKRPIERHWLRSANVPFPVPWRSMTSDAHRVSSLNDLEPAVQAKLSSVNAVLALSAMLTQSSSPSQAMRLVATAVPSPGNAGSFEAGGTLALIAFGIPKETALAFMFLYHLTQVVPGFVGGVLVLVLEGETLFGKQSLFSFRPPELPDVAHVAPEPDPG